MKIESALNHFQSIVDQCRCSECKDAMKTIRAMAKSINSSHNKARTKICPDCNGDGMII